MSARVLITEDHPSVSESLKRALERDDHKIQTVCTSAEESMREAEKALPDLMLIDISLRGPIDGIELVRQVKKQHGDAVKCVIYTQYPEEQRGEEAYVAGADGYVTKEVTPRRLRKLVKKALSGEKAFSDHLLQSIRKSMEEGKEVCPLDRLNPREREVVHHLSSTSSVGTIAETMHVSEKTVYAHIRRARNKLGLADKNALTHWSVSRQVPMMEN